MMMSKREWEGQNHLGIFKQILRNSIQYKDQTLPILLLRLVSYYLDAWSF